jgi:leucyl aminopeptidase (aminopeptidase T)
MIYKFPWALQTKQEERPPLSRIGFTETIPIDIFIASTNIDYLKMRERNLKIANAIKKCKKIKVHSAKSNFEVGLINKDSNQRGIRTSDSDVRSKIDLKYYVETKIKAGKMANIPGGEAFITPEYVKGRIIGDVVINIEASHMLSKNNPVIIESDVGGYKIISGPSNILSKIKKYKNEAWQKLTENGRCGSLPREIIKTKIKNFNYIGEFAINTNPHAKLCNYLIVNEKIKGMIHVALGSGFDHDKTTNYHYDIVIDAKTQKLDIYGVTGQNKIIDIMKKGHLQL